MTDKELVENNKYLILENAFDENDFETIEYLFDNYGLNFSYQDIIKYLGVNNQIIKKYFDKKRYNRKEQKRILLSCYFNIEMIEFFVDECEIMPTLSCFKKAYRNVKIIRYSKEVYEFLLNHKTLPEIYLKYKDELRDINSIYYEIKIDMEKKLRNKKIKNLIL